MIAKAPHIERPLKPPPKDRHLTPAETVALIEAISAPHLRLAVVLLLTTAARVSAIIKLTWDRIDFERGRIILQIHDDQRRVKGRAVVPMNRTMLAVLESARAVATCNHVIEYASRPVKSIKRGVARSAERADLEGVSAHVLRTRRRCEWQRVACRWRRSRSTSGTRILQQPERFTSASALTIWLAQHHTLRCNWYARTSDPFAGWTSNGLFFV